MTFLSLSKLGVVLTSAESVLVCEVLNRGGRDDGRPVADDNTIRHFTAQYVVETCRMELHDLSQFGTGMGGTTPRKMADRIIKRIDAMLARKPNICDGCDEFGSNGTMDIDGELALVVCCPSCARSATTFQPF